MLSRLINLTSLDIKSSCCCDVRLAKIKHRSYVMVLPGLRRLRMTDFAVEDLGLPQVAQAYLGALLDSGPALFASSPRRPLLDRPFRPSCA